MEIVALVAAKAEFHVGTVVGILFDPCCITRATMTRMNHVHRHSDGQPFSANAHTVMMTKMTMTMKTMTRTPRAVAIAPSRSVIKSAL